jgi:hypothetical protein
MYLKDIIIFVIALIIVAGFIGHIEINTNPFCIRLPMWHRVVALILFFAAWGLWDWGERLDAYSKGLKRGMDITLEQYKENKK